MWLIATLAGLVGLVILALCVPLDAVLSIDTSEKPRFRLRMAWFFGLISKELHREKKKPKEEKKVTKEKRKKGKYFEVRTILQILRTKGLLKQVKNLVKGVLGQLKIKELAVNLKLGLENPADTGFVFALIGSITPFLNLPSRYQIRVQPSFYDEAIVEGYLRGVLRLQPIKLVIPLLKFVFSLTILRVVKTFILSKWKRKK
ncbi:DUF2953 domain-containing protein [Chloroflexota bacterium]